MHYGVQSDRINVEKVIHKISLLHSAGAETPTHPELVDRLIDGSSIDWSNPNLKILDPACGRGNFLLKLLIKLREYHSDEHIVKNMLYGADNNVVQSGIAKKALRLATGYNANILCVDSLAHEWDQEFDLVITSPPFGHPTTTTLKWWHLFVQLGARLLKDKGQLTCITPRAWLERPNSQVAGKTVKEVLSVNQINWIDITVASFITGETTCAFNLTKEPKHKTTTLITFDDEQKVDYIGQKIPLSELDKIKIKLFPKILDHKGETFLRRVHSDSGTDGGAKEKLQTTGGKDMIPCFNTASNTDTYWIHKKHVKQGIKVILNRSGYYYSKNYLDKYMKIDTDNSWSIGVGAYGVVCNSVEEAENMFSYLSSNFYRWFIENEKSSGFNTGITKLPVLDTSRKWTNKDVYEYFDLSSKDIKLIEKYLKETIDKPKKK
jgi:hypothetical protein